MVTPLFSTVLIVLVSTHVFHALHMFTDVDPNMTQEHVYIYIVHAQKHINHSYYQASLAIITLQQQSVDISSHTNRTLFISN